MTKEFDYTQFKEEAIRGIKEGKSFSGEDNVMLPMIKDLLESAMKAELDIHMESERAQDGQSPANRKNGKTTKTIKSAYGSFSLDNPHRFMPLISAALGSSSLLGNYLVSCNFE